MTMKNVIFIGQKGGVGKSTLADELGWCLEMDGIPFNFFDLDGQGSTEHENTEVEDALLSVIDTPGHLQVGMSEWIQAADVVIVPTRPTKKDIKPLAATLDAVRSNAQKTAKVIVVVNGYNRYTAAQDFMDWATANIEYKVMKVRQSEALVQSSAFGTGVFKRNPRSKVAHDLENLFKKIYKACGLGKMYKAKARGKE